jgi:DnaJ-class molecular chaperone
VTVPVQTSLDQLHPCIYCSATGKVRDRETDEERTCRVCDGTGSVNYDPEDETFGY